MSGVSYNKSLTPGGEEFKRLGPVVGGQEEAAERIDAGLTKALAGYDRHHYAEDEAGAAVQKRQR